jgi:hypothetical protein
VKQFERARHVAEPVVPDTRAGARAFQEMNRGGRYSEIGAQIPRFSIAKRVYVSTSTNNSVE